VTDYDVIVVGAGPAGSTAARVAAEGGLRVAIFEGAAFPREKLCGGFVSARALAAIGVPIPDSVIERRIRGVEVRSGEKRRRHLSTSRLGITVRRAAFDAFLLDTAREAGAELHLSAPVRRIVPAGRSSRRRAAEPAGSEPPAIEPAGSDAPVTAQIIIDARGAASLVGRRGPLWPFRRYSLGFAYGAILPAANAGPRVPAPGAPPGPTAAAAPAAVAAAPEAASAPAAANPAPVDTLILDESPVRAGFGWAFPFDGAWNVGVGAWTPARRGLGRAYWRVASEAADEGLVAPKATEVRPRAAFLPPGGPPYRLAEGGVLYVGDAAGMIDPFGGEGIWGAAESGRRAAEAAVSVLASPRPGGTAAPVDRGPSPAGRVQTAAPPTGRSATRVRSCVAARYRLGLRPAVWELRFALLRAGLAWFASWRRPTAGSLDRTARIVVAVMKSPVAYRRWLLGGLGKRRTGELGP
jgi:flavin-dependent dehydrogenase